MFFIYVFNKNDLEMIVCFIRNFDNCIYVIFLLCLLKKLKMNSCISVWKKLMVVYNLFYNVI